MCRVEPRLPLWGDSPILCRVGSFSARANGIAVSARRWRRTRRFPVAITLTDFDSTGVEFEIASLIEEFRIAKHGGETEFLRRMLMTLRREDIVLDVGANVGLVALHAARTGASVTAVEPDPHYRGRLRRNLSLNPQLRVEILDFAIADADGTAELHSDYPGGYSPSLARQSRHRLSQSVPVRSLDSLIIQGELSCVPTVLKIDIEGAEWLALRGARAWLSGSERPRAIFLELHPDLIREFGGSVMEILAELWALGYRSIWESGRQGQLHFILTCEEDWHRE